MEHDESPDPSDEGQDAKAAARKALVSQLRAIGRTARTIGKKTPGFENRFRLPYPSAQSDQAVLSAGRVFCKEAKAEKDRFLALAMPDTFVRDLQKLVGAFADAILDHVAGQSDRASAQAGITSALAKGLDAVQTLHTIVANQLLDSPEAMSAWERARKVERSRRTRKTADQAAAPEAPAGPVGKAA